MKQSMVVDREYLKPFLLHPETSVCAFVARDLNDYGDEDADLMPLGLDGCERYGDEANGLVLAHAESFCSKRSTPALGIGSAEKCPHTEFSVALER